MLSKNFSLEEMIFSEAAKRAGIDNTPPPEVRMNLQWLCEELLEPIRELLGKPIIVTSGYRSPEVNALIGGSRTSEHMDGRAADFRVPHMTPYEVCRKIEDNKTTLDLPFNQLIHEFGSWTHISLPKTADRPKYERLTAKRVGSKTVYVPGIVPVV